MEQREPPVRISDQAGQLGQWTLERYRIVPRTDLAATQADPYPGIVAEPTNGREKLLTPAVGGISPVGIPEQLVVQHEHVVRVRVPWIGLQPQLQRLQTSFEIARRRVHEGPARSIRWSYQTIAFGAATGLTAGLTPRVGAHRRRR